MMRLRFFTIILSLIFSINLSFAEMRTSIIQYGVTWTFDGEYECGQFVTGDWWVVGPVTITSVSPLPTPGRNGSCLNPVTQDQGYDDRSGSYSTTHQVTYPCTLQADQSLVSSVSKPEGENVSMSTQAVLTIVGSAPAAGTFRPAYAGTYKKYFNVADIQSSLLPDYAPPASTPSASDISTYIDMPRIDHVNNWTIQKGCSEDNWTTGPLTWFDSPCYGRGYTNLIGYAALYAMLDVADKDEIVNSLIQIGIDNYGVLKTGGGWAADGGHHSGRKFPVVFAATLLNDADMLQVGTEYGAIKHFGEDDQTYYGSNGVALWGQDCVASGKDVTVQFFLNGCTGSGAKDCRDPEGLIDGCPEYRDNQTSRTWPGFVLAARMLQGAQTVWGHDALFDYTDRWMNGDVEEDGAGSHEFVNDMWALYRDGLGGDDTVSAIGISVSPASISLNINQTSELSETFVPVNTTNKNVTWSSSHAAIATVDQNGLVTAVSEGTATITVTSEDGGHTASCAVTISDIGGTPVNLALGKPAMADSELNASYPASNAVDGDYSPTNSTRWVSDNTSGPHWIEVDLEEACSLTEIKFWTGNGGYNHPAVAYQIQAWTGTEWDDFVNVTGNTNAEVTHSSFAVTTDKVRLYITAGTDNYARIYELEIWGVSAAATIPVSGITVSQSVLNITHGQVASLSATVSPADATSKSFGWASSNPAVATVDADGGILAISEGVATITATTHDGGHTASCTVNVEAASTLQRMNLDAVSTDRFTITDVTWPENVGEAAVCMWNDDKVAAVSLTIDDNIISEHDWWLSMRDKYPSLKFTWFFIYKTSVDWALWQRLVDEGQEVQAHDWTPGQTHGSINDSSETVYHHYCESLKNIIEANVSGQKCATFAYPYGTERSAPIRELFIAMRGVTGVMNRGNRINYLNVNSRSRTNDLHDIQVLLDENETLYNTSYYRGWLSNHYHQLNLTNEDLRPETETFLSEIHDNRDVLWCGGFHEVARYGQERDSHTLTVTEVNSTEISFNLSDEMNDYYFDFPLTVKIRIDSSWTEVNAMQNQASVEATIVENGGNKYALVKAVPDRGEVIVSPTTTTTPVNNGPAIDPVDNVTALVNTGQQTINLTGINDGDTNTQTLSIAATSSNESVVNNVIVDYESGNVTGTSSYIPVSAGTATITITVTDDGGTVNGGVDTKMISFDITVEPSINVVTGIGLSQSAMELRIHPNPCTDMFTVELSGSEKTSNVIVQLSDLSGKVVFSEIIDTYTVSIQTTNLTEGIYNVSVMNGNNVMREKLILR